MQKRRNKAEIMAQLVINTLKETPLSRIMQMVRPYMKGLVYEVILVKTEERTITLNRTKEGYKMFGCLLTPEIIRKRYS